MKKIISGVLLTVLLCAALCACGTPEGMTESDVNACKKVIEITDSYLDFNISKSDAEKQIGEISDRLSEIEETTNDKKRASALLGITIYTRSIEWELVSSGGNDDEILKSRNEIAEEIGVEKRK